MSSRGRFHFNVNMAITSLDDAVNGRRLPRENSEKFVAGRPGFRIQYQLFDLQSGKRSKTMENWKRVLLTSSAGISVICLFKGSRTGGLVFGGIALATLASEYPDTFARIRKNFPDYIERGSNLLDIATRVGERMAELAERRGSAWYDSLVRG